MIIRHSGLLILFLFLAACGKPTAAALVKPWTIEPTDFGMRKIHGVIEVNRADYRYLEVRFRGFDHEGNQRGIKLANIESPSLGTWAYEITISNETDRVELIGVFSSPNADKPIN
jgi:hypothetical protein